MKYSYKPTIHLPHNIRKKTFLHSIPLIPQAIAPIPSPPGGGKKERKKERKQKKKENEITQKLT
jgi:hypothetical protein